MDMMQYRIPNWCVIPGMAVGLILAWQQGAVGLLSAVMQSMAVFMIFYPFYLLGGMGAGDVKLFMLLACYLDRTQLIMCIAVAMLLAGLAALIRILVNRECREHVKEMFLFLRKVMLTGAVTDTIPSVTRAATVRLALPVLCSTLLCSGGILP